MPMSEPVVSIKIVEYHPRWPILYTEERARVVAQLGDMVESIEHIGSTSVPGLSAKPIIDILVTVARLGPADPYIERLGSLGYTFLPVLGNADRYAFGKGSPHTHHIHIVEHSGEEHIRPLAFRDYLRTHVEAAQQYDKLKRMLADRFQHDRQAYNQAKTDFIRSIETKARRFSAHSKQDMLKALPSRVGHKPGKPFLRTPSASTIESDGTAP
jgi:GrpB-like predicted nucleotidyltransferase (UPF0157 family)